MLGKPIRAYEWNITNKYTFFPREVAFYLTLLMPLLPIWVIQWGLTCVSNFSFSYNEVSLEF